MDYLLIPHRANLNLVYEIKTVNHRYTTQFSAYVSEIGKFSTKNIVQNIMLYTNLIFPSHGRFTSRGPLDVHTGYSGVSDQLIQYASDISKRHQVVGLCCLQNSV